MVFRLTDRIGDGILQLRNAYYIVGGEYELSA